VINIFDEKSSVSKTFGAPVREPEDTSTPLDAAEEGSTLPFVELPLFGIGELEQIVDSWKKGLVYHRNYAAQDDSDFLTKLQVHLFAHPPIKCMLHVPFTHGTLCLGSEDRNGFTQDDTRTLQELAQAISVGYRRFLDFRELDRRNRELQRAQLQLIQSEKMASLGELAAGVAHELNTPMGAIKSNTDVTYRAHEKVHGFMETACNSKTAESKKLRELMFQLESLNQVTRGACERVITIVNNLRSFARLDEAEWKVADLHQGVEDTLTLIHHRLQDRIEVIKKYGDLPAVACYPKKMNQVFMVLLMNATQAIDGRGEITVETLRDNEQAVIRVSDTGRGIRPDIMKRIFDPGFTTKGVGVGTGLGLSICHQIVEEHRGRIDAVSTPGEGSTFTVRIPLGNGAVGPNGGASDR
jgi:signal transduction histidine kinase